MPTVLIIDDDKSVCETMINLVRRMGHDAVYELTLEKGVERAHSQNIDVVFLDVKLPDGNGLEMLPKIQSGPSLPEVIIMTGFGDPDGAELAIRHGAWDYLQKPSTIDAVTLSLVRSLRYREEKKAAKAAVTLKREGIIGNSPKLKTCLDLLGHVAGSDANVFLTGETGTGKELFAWAIHDNSPRERKNFVVVDCAALPENLVESILFGHEKGAYTGADKAREGLILQADGGTLFLDEVGELPLMIQKSFLRVLHERRFRPVGGKEEIASDFRLIAASNRNLDEMVRKELFREDLLFRLRSFTIDLPPLRERMEDIPDLVAHYASTLCERYRIDPKEFSPDFYDALLSYSWPGNVRELIHAVERALVNGRYENILFAKHLPTHIRAQIARSTVRENEPGEVQPKQAPRVLPPIQEVRDRAIADVEKKYLRDLITSTRGDIKEACQLSGLSRSRLYLLLKKYNIATAGSS